MSKTGNIYGATPYRRPDFSAPVPFQPSEPQPSEPLFPPSKFTMQTKPYAKVLPPIPKAPGKGSAMPFPESETAFPESETQATEMEPDPYVNNPLVPGLNKCTFWSFINNLDVAFVLYYDPCEVSSGIAKLQIRGAVNRTQRDNHKYVAVDCSTETELCKMQNINTVPSYQLFSRGALVNSYMNVENLRVVDIMRLVETAPVLDEVSPMSCQTK